MGTGILRRLGACQRGSSAVEFALVAPALVTMLFGIFEFGRALWTQGLLDYAVEQASRCAAVNTTSCGSNTAIATFASQQTAPLNLPVAVFTSSTAACGHSVTASYAFQFVASALLPFNITLTSQSCYPS